MVKLTKRQYGEAKIHIGGGVEIPPEVAQAPQALQAVARHKYLIHISRRGAYHSLIESAVARAANWVLRSCGTKARDFAHCPSDPPWVLRSRP